MRAMKKPCRRDDEENFDNHSMITLHVGVLLLIKVDGKIVGSN